MILGIGTDIVEIARIESALEKHQARFAQKILSDEEMLEYAEHKEPARLVAKRFAAKEACLKAMGWGVSERVTMPDLTVVHDPLGKPDIKLSEQAMRYFAPHTTFHLSITDERLYAGAFVVIET